MKHEAAMAVMCFRRTGNILGTAGYFSAIDSACHFTTMYLTTNYPPAIYSSLRLYGKSNIISLTIVSVERLFKVTVFSLRSKFKHIDRNLTIYDGVRINISSTPEIT